MIIPENREKVKRKVLSLINKVDLELKMPEKKFLLEIVMGMLMSGSCNVTEIARSLCEKISIKQTLKRLSNMLEHDHLLEICNKLCLSDSYSRIDEQTILALDVGDMSHQYGSCFEYIAKVHDGSCNDFKSGYWLNQVSGYNPVSQETFPLLLDIYSTQEDGFKSSNTESFKLVSKVYEKVGNKGLWVLDRAYDRGEVLRYFMDRNLHFMMRINDTRSIYVKDKRKNIKEVVKKINRRLQFGHHSKFGKLRSELAINGKRYEVTLICFKDKRNKEPILLLTNGWIKSAKELKRRIRGYFRRWGVEESYRFEKQGFGIEKSTVRNYKRIKTLIGVTLLSWLVLAKINESPKLKENVLKEAKMEKTKRKQRPKFIYYRLLKGVQNMFKGIKELFRFRWKRRQKNKYRKSMAKLFPLFPEKIDQLGWLEVKS
jgi:hypothetical protein